MKTITCLESAHSTAGDVLLYWYAIAATLEKIFSSSKAKIPEEVQGQVRAIYNRRFQELFAPTLNPTRKASATNPRLIGPHKVCLYLHPGMDT
jgi:hypothetical protein